MADTPRLPLNTITAFRAVAELENLRAAAEVLHLTHSAVSQQIRGLEEQLGFVLFERRGRRVVLNPSGQALLRSVQAALSLLDDGVQAAAAAAQGAATRLRVTVLPSFANRWLLPRIGRWREQHPALALEIDASIRPVDLQREGFHAAVRQRTGPWPGVQSERLSGGIEHDAATAPLEQREAELVLEPADLLAHRAVRQVQRLSGGAQVLKLGHRAERGQRVEGKARAGHRRG